MKTEFDNSILTIRAINTLDAFGFKNNLHLIGKKIPNVGTRKLRSGGLPHLHTYSVWTRNVDKEVREYVNKIASNTIYIKKQYHTGDIYYKISEGNQCAVKIQPDALRIVRVSMSTIRSEIDQKTIGNIICTVGRGNLKYLTVTTEKIFNHHFEWIINQIRTI